MERDAQAVTLDAPHAGRATEPPLQVDRAPLDPHVQSDEPGGGLTVRLLLQAPIPSDPPKDATRDIARDLQRDLQGGLQADLMCAVRDYVQLVARMKQLDELPPGDEDHRWRLERETFEMLGRVRRSLLCVCRNRGLA